MTVRYVLTSACIQSGTMALTASLRQRLLGKERVRFLDEDGEAFEAEVDWKGGLLRGLGPYYAKRRLAANEVVLLHFRGEEVELKALPRALPRLEKPREEPKEVKAEAPQEKRRVRVTPYPKEVLFPHEPKALEPPGITEDLRRLGFLLEGGPPWLYKAPLGRRQVALALLRLGEGRVEDLKPYRMQGVHVALLAPESEKEAVPPGVAHLSPEAVSRLVRLKGRFPLSPLDLEDLLRQGRVDLEAVEALEDRLAAELAERGALAALLLLLARKRLGEVFLLPDLEAEALEEGLIPEVVRQGVELLVQPPFLLLKRLSPGEFLLRQEVEEGLRDLAAFAEGVLARLSRVREGA
ncbi:hypothetical protein SAMN04488243_12129 [Thermus arciformis]|uniref:Uncharacterized protein n=1 Tax=Thermus arciformis TaxID=482827 RepID=A0A1G7HSM1_9DEIN|nr:hypothetical protein [Thermus arciformis]SDF03338.1 hypothetical protein SAMN04488243_12129 [Thermus arciformis]